MDVLSLCKQKKAFSGDEAHYCSFFFFSNRGKAFDMIWRAEILNYLHETLLRENLPMSVLNLLSKKKFWVRVGASHSEYTDQEEGLLHGSIVSITCFATTIN